MKCEKHPEREAIGVCANCGKAICVECRVEIEGKNYCKNCVSELFEEEKKADLKSVMKKFDITLFIGPALAIIASFLPWMTVQILGIPKDINAFNMPSSIGTLYFLLALAAFGIAWISKPSTKSKGLIGVGILMAIFSVTSLLSVSYAISQMESKLKENPFGALAGVDIGIGLILAIIASIIIIYTGYKLSSPDLSTSVPKIRSRKVLMVLNGILGLFASLLLGSSIFGCNDCSSSYRSGLFVSSLIMVITYFYTSLYAMFELTERSKIVYSAFIGFVAVIIMLAGLFTNPWGVEVLIAGCIITVLIPLLVYVANLWYARK